MRLVLLGDLHFFQLAVWPWQLLSKRLLGQTNLWFNRRRHFRLALWPAIRDRVASVNADALLCSGDLTTTALRGEYQKAHAALAPLLDSDIPTLMVPGNHDRYTYTAARKRYFEEWFRDWSFDAWPGRRTLGEAEVMALDPTRPNPFNASGYLGNEQRERLHNALQELPDGRTVIVLCHYPIGVPHPHRPEAPGHGLQDTEALLSCLRESARPIIYVHGHVHQPWVWRPAHAPNVLAINAGAPMLTSPTFPQGQGFAELLIENSDDLIVRRHLLHNDGSWQTQDDALPDACS